MSSPGTRIRAALLSSLSAGVILVASGCDSAAPGEKAEPAIQLASPSISLRVSGAEGYRETLASLRGKVVLVDFWATWCAPCIEQFPHTVALHRKLRDSGLAVVTVSMNEPGEAPQVREFLTRHKADFENLLSQYESGVKAIEAFDLPGPVPCYRVYDREGELRHEFVVDPRAERQFTPVDIETAVAELL